MYFAMIMHCTNSQFKNVKKKINDTYFQLNKTEWEIKKKVWNIKQCMYSYYIFLNFAFSLVTQALHWWGILRLMKAIEIIA